MGGGASSIYWPTIRSLIMGSLLQGVLEEVGSPEELVRRQVVALGSGVGCAALHPLIQVPVATTWSPRWGTASPQGALLPWWRASLICTTGDICFILTFSHVPLVLGNPEQLSGLGKGRMEVEEVLSMLREDQGLRGEVEVEAEEEGLKAKGLGVFQRRMFVTVTRKADRVLAHALLLARPGDVSLGSWVQQLALTLYTRSSTVNDFFLLHGVTAARALTEQVPAAR